MRKQQIEKRNNATYFGMPNRPHGMELNLFLEVHILGIEVERQLGYTSKQGYEGVARRLKTGDLTKYEQVKIQQTVSNLTCMEPIPCQVYVQMQLDW